MHHATRSDPSMYRTPRSPPHRSHIPSSSHSLSYPSPLLPSSHHPHTAHRVPRKPRKILYLIGVFVFLYYWSFRHGLGAPERDSNERPRRPPIRHGSPGVEGEGDGRAGWVDKVGLGRVLGGKGGKKVEHVYKDNGMIAIKESETAEHPIYDLMEQARQKFDILISRQSRTLPQAVAEYKNRYNMPPPKGFDAWWKFAVDKGIKIVDDYDRIHKDILPFHALSPSLFRSRAQAVQSTGFTHTMRITHASITNFGERADATRPQTFMGLLNGFREYLPEDFDVEITGSDHDLGSWVLGSDQRERAVELVRDGKYFELDELKALQDQKRTPVKGWFAACDLDSPANIKPWAENATDEWQPRSLIHQHISTMNFCQNPSLKRLHGAMSLDYPGRTPSELRPLLVYSKFANNNELLQTPLEAFKNHSDLPPGFFPTWEEKTDSRAFWRGSSTGGYNTQRPWQDSHRFRLHFLLNGKKGKDEQARGEKREVMFPDGRGGFEVKKVGAGVLNEAYFDAGLAGQPGQCQNNKMCETIEEEVAFKEWVAPKEGAKHKYALDVDGNGWSSRFHRLLSSGSAVIKMTIFPEWHQVRLNALMEPLTLPLGAETDIKLTSRPYIDGSAKKDWLVPWLHYIPMQIDYSDIYDIMAFFAGPIGEDGRVDETKGHDELAKQIGEAGREFAEEHWRWEVMQGYMFRLLLEYRRLLADDRHAMSYAH